EFGADNEPADSPRAQPVRANEPDESGAPRASEPANADPIRNRPHRHRQHSASNRDFANPDARQPGTPGNKFQESADPESAKTIRDAEAIQPRLHQTAKNDKPAQRLRPHKWSVPAIMNAAAKNRRDYRRS